MHVDTDAHCVHFGELLLQVPAILGDIVSAEQRGEFVVVFTEHGKISFHAIEPARVRDAGWSRAHPMVGKIHLHSIRKVLRTRCFLPVLRRRLDLQFNNHRLPSGASPAWTSVGRIVLDKVPIYEVAGEQAGDLVGAAADYLFTVPDEAVMADDVVMASLAAVDRRLSRTRVDALDPRAHGDALWRTLAAWRKEFQLATQQSVSD